MKILNLFKKRKKYDFDIDESNLTIEERGNQYQKFRHKKLNGFGRFMGKDDAGDEYEYIGNFINGNIINGSYKAKVKEEIHFPISYNIPIISGDKLKYEGSFGDGGEFCRRVFNGYGTLTCRSDKTRVIVDGIFEDDLIKVGSIIHYEKNNRGDEIKVLEILGDFEEGQLTGKGSITSYIMFENPIDNSPSSLKILNTQSAGVFQNGMLNGIGVITNIDGIGKSLKPERSKIIGQFTDDQLNGFGQMNRSRESITGNFTESKFKGIISEDSHDFGMTGSSLKCFAPSAYTTGEFTRDKNNDSTKFLLDGFIQDVRKDKTSIIGSYINNELIKGALHIPSLKISKVGNHKLYKGTMYLHGLGSVVDTSDGETTITEGYFEKGKINGLYRQIRAGIKLSIGYGIDKGDGNIEMVDELTVTQFFNFNEQNIIKYSNVPSEHKLINLIKNGTPFTHDLEPLSDSNQKFLSLKKKMHSEGWSFNENNLLLPILKLDGDFSGTADNFPYMEGRGLWKFYDSNGKTFQGTVEENNNALPNGLNGNGKITTLFGDIYEGSFVNGRLEGNGLKTYNWSGFAQCSFMNSVINGNTKLASDQGYYVGEYSDNELAGNGIFTLFDGTVFHGIFYDKRLYENKTKFKGEIVSYCGTKYKGEFLEWAFSDCEEKKDWKQSLNGQGKIKDVFGNEKSGIFINGYLSEGKYKRIGLDIENLEWGRSEIIEGVFYPNSTKLKSGRVENLTTGMIKEGDFNKKGRLNGFGKIIFKNGQVYVGEFKNGLLDGKVPTGRIDNDNLNELKAKYGNGYRIIFDYIALPVNPKNSNEKKVVWLETGETYIGMIEDGKRTKGKLFQPD